MKYIKQRDTYSCGPVSIINALRWAGQNWGLKDVKYMSHRCNTNIEGTDIDDYEKVLYEIGRNFFSIRKRVKNITSKELSDHILSGGSFIMTSLELKGMIPNWVWNSLMTKEREWHLSFWHSYEDNKFENAQMSMQLTKKQMQNLINESYVDEVNYPEVWLLRKR